MSPCSEAWKLVVPKEQRNTLTLKAHEYTKAGHIGVFKTVKRCRKNYNLPKMRVDVARVIRRCPVCTQCKVPQTIRECENNCIFPNNLGIKLNCTLLKMDNFC